MGAIDDITRRNRPRTLDSTIAPTNDADANVFALRPSSWSGHSFKLVQELFLTAVAEEIHDARQNSSSGNIRTHLIEPSNDCHD